MALALEEKYEGVEILPGSPTPRRLRALAPFETRVAHAEAKVEALERRQNDMRRNHEEALAEDEAAALKVIEATSRRTRLRLRETEARIEELQARKLAMEIKIRQTNDEEMAVARSQAQDRTELEQQVALADRQTAGILHGASAQANIAFNCSHFRTRGVLNNLAVDCDRAWSREDGGEWPEIQTGVRSHARDASLHLVQRPRPLPFAQHDVHPFDGYGTYGKTPPVKQPLGFHAETRQKLLEKRSAR